MAFRPIPDEDPPRQATWLNTWADMMGLLLCFFVLLFAMSVLNAKKFQQAMGSIQGAFGVMPGTFPPGIAPTPPEMSVDVDQAQALIVAQEMAQMAQLMERFTRELEGKGITGKVTVEMQERGIIIRFADYVLFDIGSADLRPGAREVLDAVGELIRDVPNPIKVEGHTDNWPIMTEKFPSNWELSTGRATTVVRYFVEELGIDPVRLEAAGYGEFHPIDTNDTAEGRQNNRRVDIVILRPSLGSAQPK